MKIAFFEIEEWEKDYLRSRLAGHELLFYEGTLQDTKVFDFLDAHVLSVFVYSTITEENLRSLFKLKLIATRSTGFDHIPIAECKTRDIIVCNVPQYGANTVAEHTFALLLNLTRKVHLCWDRTRMLNFSREGLRGIDLQGKTIGVVGTGNIGKHVIRIAKGFEMNVIAFDAFPNKELATELCFSYKSFDELLKSSDVITFHCPYTKDTHHLINMKNISLLKKDAIIINTARGGILDTEALLFGLEQKTIGAIGLDVLEEECEILEDTQLKSKKFPKTCDIRLILENHELAKHSNVIITPHNAFNSKEALQRILDTTLENIEHFSEDKIVNQVK